MRYEKPRAEQVRVIARLLTCTSGVTAVDGCNQ
jgi:hypothetical protein